MYGVALRDVWFLFWVFEFDCQEDVQKFAVSCIIFLAFVVTLLSGNRVSGFTRNELAELPVGW